MFTDGGVPETGRKMLSVIREEDELPEEMGATVNE